MPRQHFYLLTSDKGYDTFEELAKAKKGVKYVAFSTDVRNLTLKELGLIGNQLLKLLLKI